MPPRDASSGEERMMARYVLGQLSGAELETLEDRLLADQPLFEAMEAIEAELCDDYVAGRLSAGDRAAFDARLSTHERLRRKVAFARALAASSPASERAHHPASRWWAVAAAAILVLAGAWWLTRSDPDPDVVTVSRTPLPSPSPSPPTLSATPTPMTSPGDPGEAPAALAIVATLTLFGPVVRDPGEAPVLAIRGGTGVARVDVALQDGDVFAAYRLRVTREAGGEVWNGDRLQARTTAAGRLLQANIPVEALPVGTYQMSVYGLPGGDADPARLATYVFRVTR